MESRGTMRSASLRRSVTSGTRLAADGAGVGHAARERLRQEVGRDLLQLPPLAAVGEVIGSRSGPSLTRAAAWRPEPSGPSALARSSSAKNARAEASEES